MSECPRDELLGAWLDGELPEAEATAIEAHVAECARCADEAAALRELAALTRQLDAPEITDTEWAAAWRGIAARLAPTTRPTGLWAAARRLRYVLVPAAAAALIALAVGFWVLGPYNQAEAEEVVVEYVEAAEGYSSSYYHSDEAEITIITLVPLDAEEETSSDESQDTR
jgi:anti-sigma factor RsiW